MVTIEYAHRYSSILSVLGRTTCYKTVDIVEVLVCIVYIVYISVLVYSFSVQLHTGRMHQCTRTVVCSAVPAYFHFGIFRLPYPTYTMYLYRYLNL